MSPEISMKAATLAKAAILFCQKTHAAFPGSVIEAIDQHSATRTSPWKCRFQRARTSDKRLMSCSASLSMRKTKRGDDPRPRGRRRGWTREGSGLNGWSYRRRQLGSRSSTAGT